MSADGLPVTLPKKVRPVPGILASAREAMDMDLEALRNGEQGAIVAVATTQGIRVAVMAKLIDSDDMSWSFGGWLQKDFGGELSGGAHTVFTWGGKR